MLDQVKFFFMLYLNPPKAFGNIIDRGNLWVGVVATIFVSILFWFGVNKPIYESYENPPLPLKQLLENYSKTLANQQPNPAPTPLSTEPSNSANTEFSNNTSKEAENNLSTDPPTSTQNQEDHSHEVRRTYSHPFLPIIKKPLPLVGNFGWWFVSFSFNSTIISVLSLSIIYIPITILILLYLEPLGSYGVIFRRDYAPLITCTLMGWTATHLPFALAGLLIQSQKADLALLFWTLSKLSFALLMVFILRILFNITYTSILITLSISWSSLVLESAIFLVASPFLLFWIYFYLRGDIGAVGMDVMGSFRQRQSFKRYLEACTINPQDAEAHYQLGLIHQQRRQYSEAITRFKKAVEIDKREIDAHFQLGVIAREQNRLQEAISYFDNVVLLDEKHSNSEIWREIGTTYEIAGMSQDASQALEKYIERRPYDAEGLYYYGKALFNLKENTLAKEMLKRSIEAADTAPYHRKGVLKRWRKLSEALLKTID